MLHDLSDKSRVLKGFLRSGEAAGRPLRGASYNARMESSSAAGEPLEGRVPIRGEGRVLVNGESRPWRPDWTVTALLEELGATGPGVAVERNREVVRRAEQPATRLEPGDRIEVVRLVGGG